MAPITDYSPKRSINVDLNNTTMAECVSNHQDHNYKDRASNIKNENKDIVEESRTNCKESQTHIPNNKEDIEENNNKTDKDLHAQNKEANKTNIDACSSTRCSISIHQDSDKNNFKQVDSDAAAENSDEDSSTPAVLPVLRPGFKPKGRMVRTVPISAPEAPSYIMDVPGLCGIAADGSMMEAFNKFEIKD